ncbi:hypothetical protein [Actinomadura gamaensis]|uniref:Uncharacterized protein n=1 Tax=Actinomadura gamaensis TaxID=1763541 RepID=A0ABV9U2E5_9ACTN
MIATFDVAGASVLAGCVVGGICAGASVAALLVHMFRPRPPGRHRY